MKGVGCLVVYWLIDLLLPYLGPVMTKFTIALREIGTYKEVLRSQVKMCDIYSHNGCSILVFLY